MSETKNYHLYIEDDSNTRFLDWRNAMNGPSDSNMIKIDNALSEKAGHSKVILITLYSDMWVQEGSAYIQEVEIEGLTETQNGIIGAAQNLTEEQLDAIRAAGLYISEQKDGALTIASDGDTPTCDIPAVLILLD